MTNLADLKNQLLAAKKAEDEAKAARVFIEEQIVGLNEFAELLKKGDGSKTADGVTVKVGYSRSWDQAVLSGLRNGIRDEFWPFKAEYKEDRKAMRKLEDEFPDLVKEFNAALTTKQSKPQVSIK
jgi:hypothetical protein